MSRHPVALLFYSPNGYNDSAKKENSVWKKKSASKTICIIS